MTTPETKLATAGNAVDPAASADQRKADNATLQPAVDLAKALIEKGATPAEAAATAADTMKVVKAVAPAPKPIDATPSSPLSTAAKIAAMHNRPGATPLPIQSTGGMTVPAKLPAPGNGLNAPKPAPKPNVPLPATAKARLPVNKAPTTPLIGGNAGTANPFADLMSKAAELGTVAGKGRNTQIQFHLAILDAGYAQTIDLTTNKHGPDRDDALMLSEAYVRAQNTATIFDPKAPNQRKATSLVRTCIKLGHYRPKNGGAGEPVVTVNALMTEWRRIRNSPNTKLAKRLDDATNTLMRFARAQLKDDRLIPASRFSEFMLRKDRELPDATELVARARDALKSLMDGKAAEGTAKDDSQEVTNAHQWLTVRLAKLAEEAASAKTSAAPAKP